MAPQQDRVELEGVLAEFRTALEEEINAARVFESSNAVDLMNGRRIAKIGKNYQYLFEIENALNLPGDTPGDLIVPGNPPLNVIIVSIEGLAITVSVSADLGSFVASARLKSNLTYLMKKLIERIEGYANKRNPVGERIMGAQPVTGNDHSVPIQNRLNQYQSKAVFSAIGRDATFIWGPPGTGKTQTIGEIGFQLYSQKRPVLLVSHTNTAVDQAILRIGQMINNDELARGKAVRVGDPKDNQVKQIPDLLLQTHVDRRSAELAEQRDQLTAQLDRVTLQLIELTKLIDLCEWVQASKEEIQVLTHDLREQQNKEREIEGLKIEVSEAKMKLSVYEKAAAEARSLIKVISEKVEKEQELNEVQTNIFRLEKTLESKAAELSREKELLKQTTSVGWLTRNWKNLPNPEEQEAKVAGFEAEYGNLGTQLDQQQSQKLNLEMIYGRILRTIDEFDRKYGSSPEVVISQAAEQEELVKSLTKRIRIASDAARTSRVGLEQKIRQKAQALKTSGLIKDDSGTAEKMLNLIVDAYEQAKLKVAGKDLGPLIRQRDNLNDKVAEIEAELYEIEESLKKIEEIIISEAEIVATTLTRAYLRDSIQSRRFDTVILDEASMAPIPALWIAAGLAENNAVVVGDPKQLPPIVISEKDLAQKWLGRDIFEEAGLTSYGHQAEHLAPLWMQYRMHPSISVVPNELIYDNRLIDGELFSDPGTLDLGDDRCDKTLFEWYWQDWGHDNPVLLVDTGPLNAWVTSVARGKHSSRLNFLSATICVDLAERVLRDDRDSLESGSPPRILIISPYRPHARLMDILIKEQSLENDVRSGTVHNFQGTEADLVIFDLVNDEPHFRVGMFIPALDADMKRLINVALTRAKRRLFVVGDFEYIQRMSKKAFLGGKLIPFLKERFPCIDANSVVPYGLASRSAEAQATVFGGNVEADTDRMILTQDQFYPYFCGDVNVAKNRVIIYSPFITQDRLAIMEPALKSAIERDVEVFIITKALGDRGKREISTYRKLESALEKWGVVVIHKRRMHEKLAIIDNSMLWVGSLNILSFSSTQEIMERRFSRNIVEDYIKTLRINDLLREYEEGAPNCPICESEIVASEGRDQPFYWRCVVKNCYSRSIDQPAIKSGKITCSNCGGSVEYGDWGGMPHWRCIENRMHRQKIAKTHLRLPEMTKIIPKREIKKLEKIFNVKSSKRMRRANQQASHPPNQHMKKRILIIDDDFDIRAMLQEYFEMIGYLVELSAYADERLWISQWQWQNYNCIITGINQPGLNGIDFARLVQKSGGPPLIVMSGYKPEAAKTQAKDAGAAAFIVKPFNLENFAKILEACCK